MRFNNKLILVTMVILFMLMAVSQSFADVSDAALLYLRIAPGSRAAGMGEAYVAISDDATSTHWNPAGLGSSPLSGNWNVHNVPQKFQPVSAIASQKARGGSGYDAYDTWAITPQGLTRFDGKRWHISEVFPTKTTHTVADIVEGYINVSGQKQLKEIVDRVIVDNSNGTLDELSQLADSVMAAVPESYKDSEALQLGFDSLLVAYQDCRINWDKVKEADKLFRDGMNDGALTESELDKINFAIEKAKKRFIPEEIKLHYSSILGGNPQALATRGGEVYIGTDNGMYMFNGRRWRQFTTEDGLPSMNIISLSNIGAMVYIGTDQGLVRYENGTLSGIGKPGELPDGAITALGGVSQFDLWVVANSQIYHFDGSTWSSSRKYQTVMGDTPESIVSRFAIFDTKAEKDYLLQHSRLLSQAAPKPAEADEETSNEANDESTGDTATVAAEPVKTQPTVATLTYETVLEPGSTIEIPYAGPIPIEVSVVHVDLGNNLWLGTEHGAVTFKDNQWLTPGLEQVTVAEGQTIDQLIESQGTQSLSADEQRKLFDEVNDMGDAELFVGQKVLVAANPAAAPINFINSRGNDVYVASKRGLFKNNGDNWEVIDRSGLVDADVLVADVQGDGIWFVTDKKIVTRGNGQSDISMMFAKWLPELSDDIYYFFLSGATSVENLGTFGGNITYISYGVVNRTDANGNAIGTFEPFDIAFTLSYGTSLTSKLKGGLSARFIYSQLSSLGAGEEKGSGTATGMGLDLGLLYHYNDRLTFGTAITNLGPDVAYIDAAQSDPLPRNWALGFSYKILNTDYYHLLMTSEFNKSLVGMNESFSDELKEAIFNGGIEFMYSKLVAFRAGYIYDEEGDVKTITLGFGVRPLSQFQFDFAYIPSSTDAPLANTLRISMQVLP